LLIILLLCIRVAATELLYKVLVV